MGIRTPGTVRYAAAEYRNNIWTPERNRVSTLIEYRIKLNWVGLPSFCDGTGILVEACDDGDVPWPGLGGRPRVADAPPALLLDHPAQERRSVPPPLVRLEELVRPEPVRDEEDEALGGRRGEAGRHGGHAVDDGGLEVDVEYAQHVDGVERDAKDNQPPLAPPRGGGR